MDQLLNPKSIDQLLDDHYDVDDEIKLNNQLIDAIKRNSISEISEILHKNPSIINFNFFNDNESALTLAVRLKNYEIVKLLLEFDQDWFLSQLNQENLLKIAIKNNDPKILSLLMYDLKKRNDELLSQQAILTSQDSSSSIDSVKSFDSLDSDSELKLSIFQKLLINALLDNDDFEVIKLLANFIKNEEKIDLNSIRYLGNNLLHISLDYKIFKFFLEQGLDINHLNKNELNPIALAISDGLIDIVANLLAEKIFEINQILCSNDRFRAIHFAILSKNFAMIDFLVENGADISVLDIEEKNIIANAVCEGEIAVLKKLISIIVDKDPDNLLKYLNYLDKNNLSPIHLAIENNDIENNNFEIIKLLISYKVNLEFPDDPDKNLLHFAELENHVMIKFLLENKCDVTLKNSLGHNFVEVVLLKKNYVVMKILYDFKIDLRQALHEITLNSSLPDQESYDLINYLEFFYSSEILEKLSLAYQENRGDCEIKFDPQDKLNFPAFSLFEIMIFFDANFRGGVIKNAEMVKVVVDFVRQNPHSLEIFDKISQDFLAPCSFKPSLGFFRIATLVESAKKPNIIDKLAVLQRLQIFDLINFQIAKSFQDDQQDSTLFSKTTILTFEILKIINQKFSLEILRDDVILSQEQQDQISSSTPKKSTINQELWLGISSFNAIKDAKIFLDRYLQDKSFIDEIYSQSYQILNSPIDHDFVERLFDYDSDIEFGYIKFLALMNFGKDFSENHRKEIKKLKEEFNKKFLLNQEDEDGNLQRIHNEIIDKKLLFNRKVREKAKEFFIEKIKLFMDSRSEFLSQTQLQLMTSSPSQSPSQFTDSSQARLRRLSSSEKISILSLMN